MDSHEQLSAIHTATGSLARALSRQRTLDGLIGEICRLAVDSVAGADHAGVLLDTGRGIESRGSTDEVAATVEEIERTLGEGPCVAAMARKEIYQVDDVSTEERWPNFVRALEERTPVRSILGAVMELGGESFGALNLHSDRPRSFEEKDRGMIAVFGALAGMALAHSLERERQISEIEHLHRALGSRDVIGQAKGILMAREGYSQEEAFELLVAASQRLNVKLRDIAQRLVDESRPGS